MNLCQSKYKPNKRINTDNLLRCASKISGYARRCTSQLTLGKLVSPTL
jgi:hypothetical protein